MKAPNKFKIIPFEKLKNTRAWKFISLYVRKLSKGICYTCGNKYPLNRLNAGHFREKRGGSSTYFNLDNLRAQCFFCNRRRHGAKDIYAKKLLEEIGKERFDNLFLEGQKSKQWNEKELDDIANDISNKLVELEKLC